MFYAVFLMKKIAFSQAISELLLPQFQTESVHNLSRGNEIYLHIHFIAHQTHFYVEDHVPELVLEQQEKNTWKLLIEAKDIYL